MVFLYNNYISIAVFVRRTPAFLLEQPYLLTAMSKVQDGLFLLHFIRYYKEQQLYCSQSKE